MKIYMTNNYTIKYAIFGVAIALIFSVFIALPAQAHASSFELERLIDPLCLFACDNDDGDKYVTYTNSNNVNSNINSPGATVNAGYIASDPTPIIINNDVSGDYRYSNNSSSRQYAVDYGVYAPHTSNYDQYPSYYSYSAPNYYDYDYYTPLYVSCSSNVSSVRLGDSVSWTAYASGGKGSYRYRWSGTDGLNGNSRTERISYNHPGAKYASVTVYSGDQQVTQNCSNAISVIAPIVAPPPIPVPPPYRGPMLDIACFADPNNASINQPVNWTVEVLGGFGPYTYTWSGSDNLSGYERTLIKYYSTSGNKSATVTVRSADGMVGTKACTNSVLVKSNAKAPTKEVKEKPSDDHDQNKTSLSAASIFSLGNVPWGWVAVLVILVLFATVLYLLFNRTKI